MEKYTFHTPSHWHLWIVKIMWGILIVVQIEHIGFSRPNGLKFRCICSTVELNPESTGHDSTFRNKVNKILARRGGILRNPPPKQVLCFNWIFWPSESNRAKRSLSTLFCCSSQKPRGLGICGSAARQFYEKRWEMVLHSAPQPPALCQIPYRQVCTHCTENSSICSYDMPAIQKG